MSSRRDEILRFVIETEGEGNLKSTAKSIDAVTKAAADGEPKAQALVDELDKLSSVGNSIKGFVALKAQLQETGDKLFLARRRLNELETEFSETLEPSKKLTKELERQRSEVARLAVEQNRQTAALQRAENTIKSAGYDVSQLARAQADNRDKTAQAAAALRKYSTELANTGAQANRTGGVLQRLRGIAAGLFAGLSIRGAAEGVKNVLELGDAAEKTRNQFTQLFGSVAAGDRAQAALKKFANDNAQPLDQTREAAIKLKAFGIDPLAGALQALTDENAAMGGSQERLEGTILAVGQAWAKQKLQGEEILQLVERGVPVWELLSKVTGKNVVELQKLSEQGKLGRKEISGLLAEIGKMNSGAAAKNANTLSGLFTQLSSRVRQFFTDVSERGPLDFFKTQLRDTIALVDRLSKSNELEAWARRVGGAIVSISQNLVGAGKFIVEHIGLITTLAKAYAAIKIGSFLAGLGSIGPAAAGAAKGLGSLTSAVGRLPGNVQIAIALIGLDLAIKGATQLGDAIGRNLPATQKWEERTRQLNAETREAAERFLQATQSLTQYRDVQIKSADAVSVLTEKERTRYRDGVEGLESYLKSQVAYYNALQQIGQLNDEGLQHLSALKAKLAEVEATIKVLDKTTAVAADSLKSKLSENARLLVKDLESAGNSSAKLGEKLEKAFESIDTDSITKVGDIGVAIATVANQSDAAGRAITNGLGASLRKLSGEDLLKFQASSVAAFEAIGLSAQQQASVLDTTLLVALEKLGVAPEKFALGMSAAGQQSIAVLQAITENARATGAQIEAAFTAAVRNASSKEDIEQLGNLLKAAADSGRISLEGAERAGYALQNRIREIAAITDPLADAFSRLGIKSQAALNATRDSAHDAFDAIVDGARRGEASQYDVQRAFEAYAQTAREAVKDANQGIRDQVELQLRAEAAAANVKLELVAMGDAGESAGKRTAAGAREATAALDETASAADGAADSAANLGASSNDAADGLERVTVLGHAAAESAIAAGEGFANAANTILGLDRVTFNLLEDQTRRFDEELAALNASNLALDERAQLVASLTSQYNLLSAAQIQTLANARMEQQQLQERAKQKQNEQRQQQSTSSSSNGSGAVNRSVVDVNIKGTASDIKATTQNRAAVEELARAIAPELERLAARGGFRIRQ